VGIDVEGDGGGGVPELGLYVFDVFAVLKAKAGILYEASRSYEYRQITMDIKFGS
jgi:hypothetical protein